MELFKTKQTTKFVVLINILLIGFLLGILVSSNVNAISENDLNYSFEKDVLYSSDNPIHSSYNVREYEVWEHDGHFNATYSFTNVPDGTSGTDIDFIDVDNSGDNCIISIKASESKHKKVLDFFDNSDENSVLIYNLFDFSQNYGTIEFWINIIDATKDITVLIYNDAVIVLGFKIYVDEFQYYDGSWHNIGKVPLDNTWYHIRIDFECTTDSYNSLAQYDWHIYVNNVHYGDYNFVNNEINIDRIRISTKSTDINYHAYYDAIGYSWDNGYEIGDNLEDIFYLDNFGTESDKWEFLYEGINDKFENGDDNPNGWTDLEDGGDDVNVRTGGTGYVELYANSGEYLGLYKNNFPYVNDIILNVSFRFEIKYIYSLFNNDVYMKVFSADGTEIIRIRINNDESLKYWVSGTTYTQLDTGFVINIDYSINLSINYETDKCTLRYTTDGVFTDSFEFPLTTTGKTGLSKVCFDICADTDYVQIYLDWIGIYVNYHSISTEYAYHKVIPSTSTNWGFDYINLVKYNAKGNISIIMHAQNYGGSFIELIGLSEIDGWNTINTYSLKIGGFSYGIAPISLYFFFNGEIELNEVNIDGVFLKFDSVKYHGICEYNEVNQHNNYFYVDNNILKFIHTSNDNNLEFIQISFNIPNVQCINRSVNYKSQIIGNAKGFLKINYDDSTCNFLNFRTFTTSPNVILPQDKTIENFVILITDDDNDNIQGDTTGNIEYIKLMYLVDVSIQVITMTLLSIMIPLLILIIPTFLIYLRLGKSAIIPMFVLMTFICFITNLIPLWLFFIVLLSCGAFMITKKITTEGTG